MMQGEKSAKLVIQIGPSVFPQKTQFKAFASQTNFCVTECVYISFTCSLSLMRAHTQTHTHVQRESDPL